MSALDNLFNALAGKGYVDGSTWLQQPQASVPGPGANVPTPPQRPASFASANPTQTTPAPQPQSAPLPPHRPQGLTPPPQTFQGFSPFGQPVGPQTGGFAPANLGQVVPPIQQPIAGSAPAIPQGFGPRNMNALQAWMSLSQHPMTRVAGR